VVFSSLSLGLGLLDLLGSRARMLALNGERGDETLNLRRLGLLLASGGFELTAVGVDVLAHIIFLGQSEELANLARTLRTAEARDFGIRETRDFGVALLDDQQVEHSNILGDNATAASLTAAFTLTATVAAEAARALGHEQEDTLVGEDTLLHAETLLVVTTHDLEDVTLPFITEFVSFDLVGDSLVVEGTEFVLIRDLDLLLRPGLRVRDVKLRWFESVGSSVSLSSSRCESFHQWS
jgi:hypothetical protein